MSRVVGPLLCAYASVLFGHGSSTGLLVLVATCFSPARAATAFLAVITSTLLARKLGYGSERISAGYYAYNGLLTGLLLSHGGAFGPRLVLLVVVASGATALLTAVLGEWLARYQLPVLALPFVLVGSIFAQLSLDPGQQPPWLTLLTDLPHLPASAGHVPILEALGAIVFQPSQRVGLLVLVGALLASRITGLMLLLGALVGVLSARAAGVFDSTIVLAASYNASLTCAALGGVFLVPSRGATLLAAASASASALLAVAWLVPFAPVSAPVLAWPFVVSTLVVLRALQLRPLGSSPALSPLPFATPEANADFAAASSARLFLPGPPRFVLPCAEVWSITQGFNGAHTHRGAWQHALDFEVLDDEGFPFTGSGAKLEDYYCFGQAVLAPGWGTVVAVYDEFPDNLPGSEDLAHPFGNAVVLQHGPMLFSVLAHLRQGSIAVAPGAAVVPGQRLGNCGASGRSPRPHLHFQVQASAWLGAPTLDFVMLNYCVVNAGFERFERFAVPTLGERIHALPSDPNLLAFTSLAPGRQILLETRDGTKLRLQSESTAEGERLLRDLESQERLYFVSQPSGVTFTALQGSPRSLLGGLFQLLPSLPAVREAKLEYRERLPAASLLPRPLRLVYELCRLLADPLSAEVQVSLSRQNERVVAQSELVLRFLSWVCWRRYGRVEIDANGLYSVELSGGSRAPGALFSARRAGYPERAEEAGQSCAIAG